MNTDLGQFVDESEATPDMNRYHVGQVIDINGDEYEIVSLGNENSRGVLKLRALSKPDRNQLLKQAETDAYDHSQRHDPPFVSRSQQRAIKRAGRRGGRKLPGRH